MKCQSNLKKLKFVLSDFIVPPCIHILFLYFKNELLNIRNNISVSIRFMLSVPGESDYCKVGMLGKRKNEQERSSILSQLDKTATEFRGKRKLIVF